jgi:hypothetical protein
MSQQIPKQKTQPKLQINNKTSYKMPTHKGNILVVSFGTQIELPETETPYLYLLRNYQKFGRVRRDFGEGI